VATCLSACISLEEISYFLLLTGEELGVTSPTICKNGAIVASKQDRFKQYTDRAVSRLALPKQARLAGFY
jgi:hypothetical protein